MLLEDQDFTERCIAMLNDLQDDDNIIAGHIDITYCDDEYEITITRKRA